MIDPFRVLLRRSWNQYKDYWVVLVLFHIATTSLGKSADRFVENTTDISLGGALFLYVAIMLISAFALSYLLFLFTKEGRPLEMIHEAAANFFPLLVVLFLLFLLFSVPFSLAKVLAHLGLSHAVTITFSIGILILILLFPRLFATPVIFIQENCGIFESFKKSYKYSKGLWWIILFRCVLILCAAFSPIAAFFVINNLLSQISEQLAESISISILMTFIFVYSFIAPYVIKAYMVQLAQSIIRTGND